jgi:hypothetical protein
MKINFRAVAKLLLLLGLVGFLFSILPPRSTITLPMKAKSALRAAYQIHQALSAYAATHDQKFPTAEQTSNDAFRELFRVELMDDEKLFFVQGSAWHGNLRRADGDLGTKEDGFALALAPGENHFAYTTGLTSDGSDGTIPIVMDGFTDTVGRWSKDPKERGGVWKGQYQVIVRVSGAAKVHEPNDQGQVMEKRNGVEQNVLEFIKLTPGARLLNPTPP